MLGSRRFLFVVLALVAVLLALALLKPRTVREEQAGAVSTGLAIQAWRSEKGARVLYVHAPQLPMVDVRLVFDAGAARDGDRPGLARLTNLLLDHGAGEWDTNTVAERFEDLGAVYGAGVARDMATVSLRSLSDPAYLAPALETLAAVVQHPRFEPAEFARERERTLVVLADEKQQPDELAAKAFYRALYDGHPYASPVTGTEASVRALTVEAVRDFHRRYYVAANLVLVIVGDVDRARAEAMAAQLADGLPQGEAAPPLPPVPATRGGMQRLEHPSSQVHILMGQAGMKRGDPDYFALYVGNHILGGSGFSSRILTEVREKRGLAYSAYSYFAPMRVEGPFVVGMQTKAGQAGEALKLLQETVRRFVDEGPTAEELSHAQKNITGGFPLRIDSNSDIAEYVAMIGFYGLPLDYLATFNARVEAVTVEAIRDAFQRRVHPDRFVTVVVGPQAPPAK